MGNGSIERSSGNAAWRSCGSTPVKSVLTSATCHNTSRRTRNSGTQSDRRLCAGGRSDRLHCRL
jgi:hypothetical protein